MASSGCTRMTSSFGAGQPAEQRDGKHPPRTKRQGADKAGRYHLYRAVAAKPGCPHRNRLDHGAVGAATRTRRIYSGSAVLQHGHIRCRPADVADKRVFRPRQPARADQ